MFAQLAGYYSQGILSRDQLVDGFFGAGQQGQFYDPSDLSTLFQERTGAAATTPAGADDPVGTILDVSGNGKHGIALSDATRPLLRTDGTYWWLEFDGIDDYLATSFVHAGVADSAIAMQLRDTATGTLGIYGGRSSIDTRVFLGFSTYLITRFGSGAATGLAGQPKFTKGVARLAHEGTTFNAAWITAITSGAITGVTTPGVAAYIGAWNDNGTAILPSPLNFFGEITTDYLLSGTRNSQRLAWLASKIGVAL